MPEELKHALQDIVEELGEVLINIEGKLDDMAEGVAESWQKTRTQMHALREQLGKAANQLEQNVEEANLQAHLAVMEASKRAYAFKEVIAEFIDHARSRSQTELDHAKLQSKLAQMEARDFVAEAKAEITDEIKADADKLRKLGLAASSKLREFSSQLKSSIER